MELIQSGGGGTGGGSGGSSGGGSGGSSGGGTTKPKPPKTEGNGKTEKSKPVYFVRIHIGSLYVTPNVRCSAAGRSCRSIKHDYPNSESGKYWIKPVSSAAFQVCGVASFPSRSA